MGGTRGPRPGGAPAGGPGQGRLSPRMWRPSSPLVLQLHPHQTTTSSTTLHHRLTLQPRRNTSTWCHVKGTSREVDLGKLVPPPSPLTSNSFISCEQSNVLCHFPGSVYYFPWKLAIGCRVLSDFKEPLGATVARVPPKHPHTGTTMEEKWSLCLSGVGVRGLELAMAGTRGGVSVGGCRMRDRCSRPTKEPRLTFTSVMLVCSSDPCMAVTGVSAASRSLWPCRRGGWAALA